jgi:prophage regulatory protein
MLQQSEPAPSTTDQAERSTDDRIIRLPEVMEITGLSKSSIYRKLRATDENGRPAPAFPVPVELCENAVGWWLSEVVAWNDSRPRRGYHNRLGVSAGVPAQSAA